MMPFSTWPCFLSLWLPLSAPPPIFNGHATKTDTTKTRTYTGDACYPFPLPSENVSVSFGIFSSPVCVCVQDLLLLLQHSPGERHPRLANSVLSFPLSLALASITPVLSHSLSLLRSPQCTSVRLCFLLLFFPLAFRLVPCLHWLE